MPETDIDQSCIEVSYEGSLIFAGHYHLGFLAEPELCYSKKNCECPTLFFHAKMTPMEDLDDSFFLEKEILRLSSSDLKDDFDGLAVGSFLLSGVLRAFHNAELGEGLFDFATFNCATVLIK